MWKKLKSSFWDAQLEDNPSIGVRVKRPPLKRAVRFIQREYKLIVVALLAVGAMVFAALRH